MIIPSRLIENAVNEVAKLPGIGKKTALRLVMHLLKEKKEETHALSESLTELRDHIKYCTVCHNIADEDTCSICQSPRRDEQVICVVESLLDVIAIENTGQFNGLYHVLGGVISPMEGIGPDELTIGSLVTRIENNGEVKEVVLALGATMEGDTTAFYLSKKFKEKGIKVSSIARGVPVGGELEYTDELTLGRAIISRVDYDH